MKRNNTWRALSHRCIVLLVLLVVLAGFSGACSRREAQKADEPKIKAEQQKEAHENREKEAGVVALTPERVKTAGGTPPPTVRPEASTLPLRTVPELSALAGREIRARRRHWRYKNSQFPAGQSPSTFFGSRLRRFITSFKFLANGCLAAFLGQPEISAQRLLERMPSIC